jgi:hypothetical protein
MKTSTAAKATSAASSPAAMLSAPSSGPMVRSSRKVISAGSAPARSKDRQLGRAFHREVAGDLPRPPVIACRITGAEITSSSSTMAKGAPTLAAVYSPKARAPVGLKRKVTTGCPVCWSKLGWLSVRSSPVTTGVCSRM